MTSIEALSQVRGELDAQRTEALRQMNQYRSGGDGLQAHSYEMFSIGLEKAIIAIDRAIRREGQALRTM